MVEKPGELINAMLYAIERYPDIGRTKLMKFIFFVDLIHYNKYERTLLADEYTRKSWGPVPDRAYLLTSSSNAAFDVEEEQLTPEKKRYLFPVKKHTNLNAFSISEITIFNAILRVFNKMTADEVSDFSHHFSLWKNFENGDMIPLGEFKLSEYEYDQLMMMFAYDEAVECCRDFIDSINGSEFLVESI